MQTSRSFRHARLPLAFASALAAAACGSSSGTTNATGPGGSTTTTTTTTTGVTTGTGGSTGGAGGAVASCPVPCDLQQGPCFPGNGTKLSVMGASATVVDTTGAPISGLEIQFCGLDICLSASTNASGAVDVTASGSQCPAPCKLTQPAFKFGDGLTYAKLAIPVSMATSSFPMLVDAPLPAMGTAFKPGGTSVSGGVTLTLPAGDVVTVDTLNYDTADKQLFRAVQLPVAQESAVIMPSGLAMGILVGVAPLETTFCPAVGVTVPNTPSWPAGMAVEFYAHGVDTFEEWSTYGGWTKISDGAVSPDGTSVSTADGQGFPVLETFAVVPKP